MNKIISILTLALLATGCTLDERPEMPTERITDVKVIVTPGQVANTFLLRSNRTDIICFWDLGNGNTAAGVNEVLAQYPFHGDYTVSMKSYGENGQANNVSVKLSVSGDNFNLLEDPMYAYIAGEIGGAGKTWMIDSERQGHIIKNPQKGGTGDYSAAPGAKNGCEMYDDQATFILNSQRGQAFEYVNNGKSCTIGNAEVANSLLNDKAWNGTASNKVATNDFVVTCTPPSKMGWSLVKRGLNYFIVFPQTANGHGGLLFYFGGWSAEYEVRAASDTHLMVWYDCSDSAKRQLILRTKDTASNNDPIEWIWEQK